jgi:hypothetical protein
MDEKPGSLIDITKRRLQYSKKVLRKIYRPTCDNGR